MAATFSSSSAPSVYDTTSSQPLGAVSTGIGQPVDQTDATGTAIPTERIGGTDFNLTVNNPLVPAE